MTLYDEAQAVMVCKTSFYIVLDGAYVKRIDSLTLTFGDVESSLSINWGNA